MTKSRAFSLRRASRVTPLAATAWLLAAACGNGASPDADVGTRGGTAGAGTAGSAPGGTPATGGATSAGGTGGTGGADSGGTTIGGNGAGGAGGASAGAGTAGAGQNAGGASGIGGSAGNDAGRGGMVGGDAGVAGGGMGGKGAAGMGGAGGSSGGGFPENPTPVVLTDDAGYCWFEDPRALFHGERLIVGSVASGFSSPARRGDIEAVVYDVATSRASVFELHNQLELDDHDSAAFLARPDGKLLAVYAKHDGENRFYYRVSSSDTLLAWGAERTFTPTSATRVTYANLFLLTAENDRIYDFYRGLDGSFKPSYAYSDDGGETWRSGNVVIDVPSTQRHRPYVRYVGNGTDTIHLVYTEAHPRDFDNSLYHVYYRGGSLYRSNGTSIRTLAQGLSSPDEGTRIYQGNRDNVAWCADAAIDASGRPVAAYSVQVGSGGLPTGQGGDDIRYRYARWDGSAWRDYALAYAGSRLYAGEDDYSGLVAIDPADVNTVFISTNSNPSTGAPLMSAADGARHYEIFRGTTANGGQTWQWTPVTRDSRVDNLRPIVPRPSQAGRRALIWLRGTYRSYTDYQQELVAVFWNH
ncbi:MAG TPA: BNR-4 repeat-containing protein [Polyangiaceae bacterium]